MRHARSARWFAGSPRRSDRSGGSVGSDAATRLKAFWAGSRDAAFGYARPAALGQECLLAQPRWC